MFSHAVFIIYSWLFSSNLVVYNMQNDMHVTVCANLDCTAYYAYIHELYILIILLYQYLINQFNT